LATRSDARAVPPATSPSTATPKGGNAQPARTGNFFIDDEVLARYGITDLSKYRVGDRDDGLMPDLFLD